MQLQPPKTRSGERGSAMVEFSILMIVFVPMLTYSFYLTDVGHHMLEVQETVISTTWDYTARTHEGMSSASQSATNLTNVYMAGRLEYLDHTSAYDHFGHLQDKDGSGKDIDAQKYHYELGSKSAWVSGVNLPPGKGQDLGRGGVDYGSYKSDYQSDDSRQIVCAIDYKADLDVFNAGLGLGQANPAYAFGESDYNRGGVVTCWAKLHVYNYIVPEKFLSGQFAHVDETDRTLVDRGTDVESLTNAQKPLTLKDHAALSFGTWALNNGDSSLPETSTASDGDIGYCPDRTNPFYAREAWLFSGGLNHPSATSTSVITGFYALVVAQTASFMGQATDVEIVNPIPVNPLQDASPVPTGLGCALSGQGSASLGLPASPITAELVARHQSDDNDVDGVNNAAPAEFDFLEYEGGPKYESSPMKNGSGDFQTSFKNRGMFYMGASSDNG